MKAVGCGETVAPIVTNARAPDQPSQMTRANGAWPEAEPKRTRPAAHEVRRGAFELQQRRALPAADQLPTVATAASDITIDRLLTDGSQMAHWWNTDRPVSAWLFGIVIVDWASP
jgi:hypothetical protein